MRAEFLDVRRFQYHTLMPRQLLDCAIVVAVRLQCACGVDQDLLGRHAYAAVQRRETGHGLGAGAP